jgi:hypothetical protein
MGVILRGILGGFSGKVANVVGGSWKGIAYMRSLPLSVANPNTAGQQAQRGNFTRIISWATTYLAQIVKPLWDRFAQGMSGFNAFVSANIDAMNYPGTPNFSQVIISRGALLLPTVNTCTASNGSPNVVVPWIDNSGTGNALGTDQVFVACYNETQNEFGAISYGADRSAGTDTLVMNENNLTGDVLHIYVAFRRLDGTLVSDTSYQTITV